MSDAEARIKALEQEVMLLEVENRDLRALARKLQERGQRLARALAARQDEVRA